jgi:hypothetical protein
LIPPAGNADYTGDIDLRPGINLIARVSTHLDKSTGLFRASFASIDPATGQPTMDPIIGFLPPNTDANAPKGLGSVLFTVTPRVSLATGTAISNVASIVFDTNAPINTPTVTNTIDATKPQSSVSPLPGVSNPYSFPVLWSGSDQGSGVRDYTIYVSDNGGPYSIWKPNSNASQGTFNGIGGHTYRFYSIARDNVYNAENNKMTAEATTRVPCQSAVPANRITVTRGGFRLNTATKLYQQAVTVTNTGAALTDVFLALDGLTEGVSLDNQAGYSGCALPGSPVIGAGALGAGQSKTITLQFRNPSGGAINYQTRFLAGTAQ